MAGLHRVPNMPGYAWIFFLIISSLFKVDLHLTYEKPINVNNNITHIYVNKLPNNNNNNETKCLVNRWSQHIANRLYITYMGNQVSTFLFFVRKILDYRNFLLFRQQVTIFLVLGKIWFWYHILQNWDFYFEEHFVL